jgi:trigger factor
MALIEGCRHSLDFEIPMLEIASEMEQAVARVAAKAHLPGFRPGKAPASVIRTRFAAEIRQEVLEALVPRALGKRFEEEKLQVVGTPKIKDLHFQDNGPIHFKAEFEVFPEFELSDYKGLPVTYTEPTLSEEEVDQRLEELRDSKASYQNIDPRPAVQDDYAAVSLKSIAGVEGDPIESDEMQIHIGSNETFVEFSEALTGMTPGEEKEVKVKYPEDYAQERLAGNEVTFLMKLSALRSKELPALDDEFAKDMGDFQTLAELRDMVKRNMLSERTWQAQDKAKDELVNGFGESYSFAVPDDFIERQIDLELQNYARSLMMQGIDPRQLNIDRAKLVESRKDDAAKKVRSTLVLDRIGTLENITASEEDVDAELQRMSKQRREPIAAVRKKLEESGELSDLSSRIRTGRIIQFLFENATKKAAE